MKETIEQINQKFKEFINDGKKELEKIEQPKDLIKQIPNFFTLTRLILTPLIVANIFCGNFLFAGILTISASITDLIDGKIARALDATSNFGANLDAIVDKIFITSIAIPLFFTNPFLIIPIAFDMMIASINGYAHIKGLQPRTNKVGKIKTFFLDTLIISTFFTNFRTINLISQGLFLATICLQLKTANMYYNTYLQDLKNKRHENKINNLKRETIKKKLEP